MAAAGIGQERKHDSAPGAGFAVVRVLSKLGFCSRMQAVELVRAGRVSVNGVTLRDPGARLDFRQELAVDGKPVGPSAKRYLIFHKPPGVVTTRSDERGRRTVYDLLGEAGAGLVPVGRLDRDSEGLLLLTNDTRFAAWLTDPANTVPRVYEVTVRPGMSAQEIEALRSGVDIGRGERSEPAEARPLDWDGSDLTLEITLTEGRNREVRRIFRTTARKVLRLRRTRFGPFELGDLAIGAWREAPITEADARRLRSRRSPGQWPKAQ